MNIGINNVSGDSNIFGFYIKKQSNHFYTKRNMSTFYNRDISILFRTGSRLRYSYLFTGIDEVGDMLEKSTLFVVPPFRNTFNS